MAEASSRPASPEARRPMSPHLQVYKWSPTMAMSILHRMSGVGLYAGTLLLAWWLLAASTNAAGFATANWFLTSIPGRLILLGFTWALFQHLLGGLRHFIWDMGRGMDAPQREYLAHATWIGAIALTILVWIAAYMAR